jgi:hypothetical protein
LLHADEALDELVLSAAVGEDDRATVARVAHTLA